MEGDSDMEISDDDRPLPSSVGSCLQTHPPAHQEAYDFLASLFLEPEVEGVWHGEGIIDAEEAGVYPGARPVDPAGGALVETIPEVDPPRTSGEGGWPGDGRDNTERAGVCPGAQPVDPEGEGGWPGEETVCGGASGETTRVTAGGTSAVPDGGCSHLSGKQKQRRRQARNRQLARGLTSAPLDIQGGGGSADGRPLLAHDPPSASTASQAPSDDPRSSQRDVARAYHHWRRRRDSKVANSFLQ